jgi:hypothetical protein
MALSDCTDVVVRFLNETGAQVFAKFVASEGIPCHIVDICDSIRPERFGVHVQRSRIDELRDILRLTTVAGRLTPIAAQRIADQLARAGIPCYVGSATSSLVDDSFPSARGMKEFGDTVAVPEPFSVGALRILGKRQLPGFATREMASVTAQDPKHLSSSLR